METLKPADEVKIRSLRGRTAAIFKLQGRRPRIIITRIPPDGSEQTVKSVAAAFADFGFDVDINLSDLPPAAVARIAMENDVHVIGLPCVSSASGPFITQLLTSLAAGCGQGIQVVAWSSVQAADGVDPSLLPHQGDFRIFGPETGCDHAAHQILDAME
jgi:methylmalonyl-CoA mutase